MLFLSLVFVLFNAYSLIKGRLFHSLLIESAEWEVKVQKGEEKEAPKEVMIKTGLLGVCTLVMLLFQMILVVSALKVDTYLFPTLLLILIMFVNFTISNQASKKIDLSTEEGRVKYLARVYKKRTFKGTVLSLINLTYFTYLFLVILEVIH